jgi:plastocyanin
MTLLSIAILSPALVPSAAAAPGERPAKVWEVKLQNVVFAPNGLTVAPGDEVKFTNLDSMCHTVTRGAAAGGDCVGTNSKDEASFDVVLNGSESVTIKFEVEGEVKLYCKPHFTSMTMTLKVAKEGTNPPRPTPGFEAVLLFGALVGAAALAGVGLARKRK